MRCLSGVAETWGRWWEYIACPDTDSFSTRFQNRDEDSPLAIHTAGFGRVRVMLEAGFAFCYGKSNNLT
jgi:hypothetical protein